jgi:predicted extracellular nuclease
MSSSPVYGRSFLRACRQSLTLVVILTLFFSILPIIKIIPTATAAPAAPAELFFSEYVEGTSNHKALEIYNGTGASINLGLNGYKVEMYFNGSGSVGRTINLTGSVANNDVFVLAHGAADQIIRDQADQLDTATAGWYNGDDAIVLKKGTVIVDVIGQVGSDPGVEWGTAPLSTLDSTLRRKSTICAGDTNQSDAFSPATEWDGFATNTYGGLGSHSTLCSDAPPSVTSTVPANNATDVAVDSNITVNFSEPVSVTGSWYSITCATTGTHTATVSGGPQSFTLNPDTDFPSGKLCTVTIFASQVADQDGTPNNMTANHSWNFTTTAPVNPCGASYTPIFQIQGSGAASLMVGQSVTTEGVVTGDFQGGSGLNGFYMQDATGDFNTATSDGIFVSSNVAVSVGDTVRVSGTVSESFNQTKIVSPGISVVNCATPATITPVSVTLPIASLSQWEQYEGMLITVTDASSGPLTATEVFTLGRFGEVSVSSGGRLFNPTNYTTPGAAAAAEQQLNDRRRLLIDDGSNTSNPAIVPYIPTTTDVFREGYTTPSVTGVLGYDFNFYRLQPTAPINWTAANPRPTSPNSVGAATARVASFNVLNYFTTIDNGSDNPRGADSAAEFIRQRNKTVATLVGLDADVVGLIEIENNGATAVNDLVTALNNALPDANDHYAVISDPANGYGTDAIKVTMIYRPAVVAPLGQSLSDNDPIWERHPVAQTFQQDSNGAIFTVVVNHFKSKSCGSASGLNDDLGDGQGCWNEKRKQQAAALLNFINGTVIPAADDPDVLIIGDLNSYAMEDPINVLTGGGYTNLISTFVGDGQTAYSYTFSGQSGYLDHALGSNSLASQVTGATEWHINADEPIARDYNDNIDTQPSGNDDERNQPYLYQPLAYRSSDHDPVLIGLDLNAPPTVSAGGPYSVGEGGSVTVTATGNDADGGQLTYVWDLDNDGNFETPGQSATFSAAGLDGPTTRTIQVRVTDEGGLTAVSQATVNVQNVAPVVNINPAGPVTLNAPVSISGSFTDAGTPDTHTAVIDWGDGTTSPGVVTESGGAGTVTGSHIYTSAGSYTVELTVTDDDGMAGSATTTVNVGYGVVALFDQTKEHKSGSTIPVKLQLVDAAGNNLSSSELVVHVTGITRGSTPVPGTNWDSGNANPGNNFRFVGDGYIFNLSTKNLLGPGEYTLHFTVTGDPTIHTLNFIVR